MWALRRAQLSVECGTVQQSGRGVWFSFCCVEGAVRDVVHGATEWSWRVVLLLLRGGRGAGRGACALQACV